MADDGPASLQINLLAKKVGATKGSFYWHFKDILEFKQAMLELWEAKAASDVIEEVQSAPSAEERLHLLVVQAAQVAPEEYGGRKIEPAMRAWALSDPKVSSALAQIDDTRMTFIKQVLEGLGLESPALAQLFYGAYIGLNDLNAKDKADMESGLLELKNLILAKAPFRGVLPG